MKTHLILQPPATILGVAVGLAVLAVQATAQPAASPRAAGQPQAPRYVEDELIVQFRESASDDELREALGRIGARSLRHVQTATMRAVGRHGLTRVRTGRPVAEALRSLEKHPAVEFVEPNWIVEHCAVSNDPYFGNGSLWGMYGDQSSPANPYGSQAAEAWAMGYTGNRSVYVAVIDTGVQYTHPDLAANMWVNPQELANGVDDDGNGYVDDVRGWNFYHHSPSVYVGSEDYHGTHVAGTLGAQGGNRIGVAGVSWNVGIVPAKFLGGPWGTGSIADAVEAVDYVVDLKRRKGINLVAINASWGGGGYSVALHEAILRAAKANILFICAAGNARLNTDLSPYYPSCYDTSQGAGSQWPAAFDAVVSVAALGKGGALASFSNFGVRTVDLAAPGVAITSTLASGGYGRLDGTSMAAPHVTGAAALYAAAHPGASAAAIKRFLLTQARQTLTTAVANSIETGGRLNLSRADNPAPVIPGAPSGAVAASPAAGRIDLSWTDNSDNETHFEIQRATAQTGPWTTVARPGTDVRHLSQGGLVSGRTYFYRLRAGNGSGFSGYSRLASAQAR